jgi:nicotinate-nucleotide adenylyltransferase
LRLGIFGGTFDPIHLGHCRAAEEMGQEFDLDKVFLIPAASPPHKSKEPVSPFSDRLEMARLAVGRTRHLEVLDIEGQRSGFSYSIQTLKEIDKRFVVIARGAAGRRDLEPVFHHLDPLAPVNDDPNTWELSTGKRLFFRAVTLMDVSSTQIRHLASSGKSIRFLVPDPVMSYIIEKKLYQNDNFPG